MYVASCQLHVTGCVVHHAPAVKWALPTVHCAVLEQLGKLQWLLLSSTTYGLSCCPLP